MIERHQSLTQEERYISGDSLILCSARVGGVTVSMVAFQAADPGSTPGQRTIRFFL